MQTANNLQTIKPVASVLLAGILYGKKLTEAGVNVELNETIGTFHGYDSAIDTQIAARNIEKRISFLQRHFMRDENHEL